VAGFTTTVAVCVTATALIVAETVFDSATVELSVPVATPLAFVVAVGWVRVFPVPVAVSTTVAPGIGFPEASRAVTVIVDVLAPLEAVIGDVAARLDCPADTLLGVTTTVAVCVTATVLMVVDTVFDAATVELKVPVATPSPSVGPTGCVTVFPVPVAASTTVAPAIGLPSASRAVTVMVELPLPAVIGDVAVTVDRLADTVFAPAAVDASVPVTTPLAFVVPTGCVSVLPAAGVAARVTVAPGIGFRFASRAVTVMVELPLPAVIGDVAVTVDCAGDTAPGVTVTVAVCVTGTPSIVADTVFDSATVELRLPVATPLPFVVALGWLRVLPVPLAVSTTVAPGIGFPEASRAVTVIVDVLVPPDATMGEVALRPDWPPDTLLAMTTTVAVCVTATALIVADTVLDSATVERNEPVATPLALVGPAGCVSVLPAPVAASVTAAPGIGLPN